MSRRREGRETWHRLLEWDKSSGAAERLAAAVLKLEGFENIDPSHPLGGPDGKKDALCFWNGERHTIAVWLPRGQKSETEIRTKFETDLEGVVKNDAKGIVFATNQEMSLSLREDLSELASPHNLELYHLERLSALLDQPLLYGTRLEYLDIKMTKEEQLAHSEAHDQRISSLEEAVLVLKASVEDDVRSRIESEAGKSAIVISPTFLNSPLSASFGTRRLFKCDQCGFGSVIAENPLTTVFYGSGDKVVTCTRCGHTTSWYGI